MKTAFTLDYASAYYDKDGICVFNHQIDDPKPVFTSIKELHEYIKDTFVQPLANDLIKAFPNYNQKSCPPTYSFNEVEIDEGEERIWQHRYSLIPINLEIILDNISNDIQNLLTSNYE